MTIKGNLKLKVNANMGAIASEVMRKGVYDIYVDELLDLAAKFEEQSYRGASLNLASSWDVTRPKKEAVTFNIKASITNTSKQAVNRIAGRGAGKMPPIGDLNDPESGLLPWVVSKGIETNPKKARGVAFAIAMSIMKKGTQRHQTKKNFAGLNSDGTLQPDSPILMTEKEIARKLKEFSKP